MQVLHLHSRRISARPSSNTVVLVRGAQRAWFQRQNYLFLSPKPYSRFGCATGDGCAGSATAELGALDGTQAIACHITCHPTHPPA